MAKKKLTAKVKDLLDYANIQLARTDEFATRDFKAGISTMIGEVLHKANRYEGFMFLNPPKGKENDPFPNRSMLTHKEGEPVDYIGCDHPEFYNRKYF
jgi:hypothetical protein